MIENKENLEEQKFQVDKRAIIIIIGAQGSDSNIKKGPQMKDIWAFKPIKNGLGSGTYKWTTQTHITWEQQNHWVKLLRKKTINWCNEINSKP